MTFQGEMMKLSHLLAAAAVAGVAFTGGAQAADAAKAQSLIKGSDCAACHAAEMKLVGPSYKDVAKKYKGNAGAVDMLVKKIKAGGSGNWGAIPMTPHPNMKDEDVKVIVEWILAM
jgi:cytochrome c